jgi:hypothetical protein
MLVPTLVLDLNAARMIQVAQKIEWSLIEKWCFRIMRAERDSG